MLRSSNPTLAHAFEAIQPGMHVSSGAETMTVQGTVNKTAMLLLLAILSAAFTWSRFFAGQVDLVVMLGIVGAIGGLIFGLITSFKRTAAPFTAPCYALAEGLFLGGISAMVETQYPGIALQAVGLTFCATMGMLMLYKARIVNASGAFARGIMVATSAIFFLYLANMVMSFFGTGIGFIHNSGPLGIGFSVFVVGLAAFNLVLDFGLIEEGANQNAPKYMEWYGAFALMVTLVWLYIEVLRLLSKLQRRR